MANDSPALLGMLRSNRNRTEAWLGVFRKMSLDLQAKTEEGLLEDWVSAMVDDLSFQVACAYRCEFSQHRATLMRHRTHVPFLPLVAMDDETCAFLRENRSGSYVHGEPGALRTFARNVGVGAFLWLLFNTRASPFLLVTGYSPQTGPIQKPSSHDLGHFVLFGSHLAALLDKTALIAELSLDALELQQSNQQLDTSLQELRETQSKLVQSSKVLAEVSRRAGMAEIATGVLHNVGNALNSVNVSAQVSSERLRALRVDGLARVADLLDERLSAPETAAATSRQDAALRDYLRKLSGHLTNERTAIVSELRTLQQHIDHIKWIISKQQAIAKTIGIMEPCSVSQLVDDAIGLAHDSLAQLEIEVVRDYEPMPEMDLDRHKVLQILVNLVSNARQALIGSTAIPKQIVARLRRKGDDRIELVLSDNGVGIAEGHMTKIFTHGFTTKKHGHGFGLHTSALAANEMGGTLTFFSEGVGRGATFTLELPARPTRSKED